MKFPCFASTAALAIALCCSPALAQQSHPAPVASERVPAADKELGDPVGRPALWKIADEDTTIYLFGTVHLLPDDVNWYSGPVKHALTSAGELVTEIDMTPEALATIAPAMRANGTLPDGQRLRDLMDDGQRQSYEAGLAKLGLAPESFDPLEPWLAAFALLQIALSGSGFTDDKGAEKVLEARIPQGTVRTALEPVDFQINVFDGLPLDQQIMFLMSGAQDPRASIAMLGELVDLWAAGDIETLGAAMNEALLSHPELAERLLYARNATWARWIADRLDRPGTVFMAVGAGHLAGDRSVQDYLTKHGHIAARVQ